MLSVSDNNTSSFNSAAESGNSLVTVVEKQPIAQSEADLTKIHRQNSKKKHGKKRGSSANSISSISKSGSTSRSRSNASRTVTVSSHNCSSHSCSYSSSACSGSFSSSYSSSSSVSSVSLSQKKQIAETNLITNESQEIIMSIDSQEKIVEMESEGIKETVDTTEKKPEEDTLNETTNQGQNYQETNNQNIINSTETKSTEDDGEKSKAVNSELFSCCACCRCCASHYPPELIVLVSPGSFNPVTMMHMRMLELARDAIERTWEVDTIQDGKLVRRSSFHRLPKRVKDTESENNPVSPVILPRRQVVVAGIFSPVSDGYKKAGLEKATSRRRLLRLACASSSDWLAVDDWESSQETWTPTRVVLEHFQTRIDSITMNIWKKLIEKSTTTSSTTEIMDQEETSTSLSHTNGLPGVATDKWITGKLNDAIEKHFSWTKQPSTSKNGNDKLSSCNCFCKQSDNAQTENLLVDECPKVRVKLVGGGDFLESMGKPGVWDPSDIDTIMNDFGLVCISRMETDPVTFIKESELSKYEQNIILASELCQNGLSATVVRRALAKGLSVRYFVPDAALDEIYASGLYGAKNREELNLPDIEELSKALNKNSIMANNSDINNRHFDEILVQNIDLSCMTRRKEILLKTNSGSNICIPLTIQIGSTNDRTHVSSKSVQTRLTALPHQQAPLVLTRMPNRNENNQPSNDMKDSNNKSYIEDLDESSLLKNMDQNTQHHVSAILPLVRQCHKCGSQKVRLILVERPHLSDQKSMPTIEMKHNEQQSAPCMQPVSVQTEDRTILKKCSNKKTQYPSLKTKKSLEKDFEGDIQQMEKSQSLIEEGAKSSPPLIKRDESLKDFKSRRPPPPIPMLSPEKSINSIEEAEKYPETYKDPGPDEREPPRQETLDSLISPASIYALISPNNKRTSQDKPVKNTVQDEIVSIESPQNNLLTDPFDNNNQVGDRKKMCKHKRHHFHSKRENTIQSNEFVEGTKIPSHEEKSFNRDNSEELADRKYKSLDKCSKHSLDQKSLSKKSHSHQQHHQHHHHHHSHQHQQLEQSHHKRRSHPDDNGDGLMKELEMRQSRTLPKSSRSQILPMEDATSTQSTIKKIFDGSIFIQGRGRSMPSVSSRHARGEGIPGNDGPSRQTTLTDDSLTELLKEYDEGELLKSLGTPSRHQLRNEQKRQMSSGHRSQMKHQCLKGQQIMNSDEENIILSPRDQQKLFGSMLKGYGKHSTECRNNPDVSHHSRHEKRLHQKYIQHQNQWVSPKLPTGRDSSLAGVDSDFSFLSEKDNAYLKSSDSKSKSRKTPNKNSFQDSFVPESMSGYKCSRHQAQHDGHLKKSKKSIDEQFQMSNEEYLKRYPTTKQYSKSSKKSTSRARI